MAYQLLEGIKVKPKGVYNLARFAKSLKGGQWPNSFAFGGWIYSASSDIGFSSQPTEIKISIVLEVVNQTQQYATFDIKDEDLHCDAGEGADENLYDIDFNGVIFKDFILYEYDISIEKQSKILNVIFKDYSVVLDKIYVGLIKRQGNNHVYTAPATIEFPVNCPDCVLDGGSFVSNASTTRDLSYGSYAGINGKVYDNFAQVSQGNNIYRQWEKFFTKQPAGVQFDLNGGYLIIGTEDATEERCGDLANVSYNFNQLLASLRYRGLKFDGEFPRAVKDADFVYKQNYIGSLREVLQQWCSDLGYDFYCDGKSFVGINLNKAIDISKIVDIADPTTETGGEFAINQGSAIISYKANTSLNNTFKQAVITANNQPRTSRTHSKSPKRYVGFLPLHPIDFNYSNQNTIIRYDAFGTYFYDIKWANDFSKNSTDRNRTLGLLDGRQFGDIDTSIALGKYDPVLRDIFCQDQAIYGESPDIRAANFRALGMVPLVELTDEDKAMVIEACVPTATNGQGNISNLCLDKRFYKVYVGYYYSQYKSDIIAWEQAAADSMYKYGILTQGLLNKYPYMPNNVLSDISPTSGLYGTKGTSYIRTQNNITPNAEQYYRLYDAPFKDIMLYSGMQSFRHGLPTGLYFAELGNDWGTTNDEFKRVMSLNLGDPCYEEFSSEASFTDVVNNVEKKYQDWRLEYFAPIARTPDEQQLNQLSETLQNLSSETTYDRTVDNYIDFYYRQQRQCSKLHLLVLTDIRTHPNISVSFTPRGQDFINPVVLQKFLDRQREAIKRRSETKTPSICDKTLLQEMCQNLLSGKWNTGPTGDPQYACVIDEDKNNVLEEGFTLSYLTQRNSRGLDVRIVKNPIRNNDTDRLLQTFKEADLNGDFYFSDVVNDFAAYQSAESSISIIYPVSTNYLGGYRGVLASEVEVENRTPEINEVFGEPVNSVRNNTSSIKVINNTVDPDLQPQLDPYSSRFLSYLTVITGDNQVITTVEQYHKMINNLNKYEMTSATKSVELSLAGAPNDFGTFKAYLSPVFGLNKLSLSVNDNGVVTSLSYSDRPPQPPKQEAILNKIGPRIK